MEKKKLYEIICGDWLYLAFELVVFSLLAPTRVHRMVVIIIIVEKRKTIIAINGRYEFLWKSFTITNYVNRNIFHFTMKCNVLSFVTVFGI